jgi:hypothetical protein
LYHWGLQGDSQGDAMAVSSTQKKTPRKMFHATMMVTRTEEWCVEADSAEEARQLLASGEGHKCHGGDCIHVEVRDLLD